MIRSYLYIAFRKASKNALYSIINLLGLSLGIAAFLFITQFVNKELRIDTFHTDGDRIYRIYSDWKWDSFEERFPNTPPALGTAIVENFEEVEVVTRIRSYQGEMRVQIDDRLFLESNSMAVDSNFLKVFNFEMVSGNSATAFSEPNAVVLPASYAFKYFGTDEALGELVSINNDEYRVTGIVENAPRNGHIDYGILLSIQTDKEVEYFEWSWVWSNLVTYIKLQEGIAAEDFDAKLPNLVKNNAGYAIERITGNSLTAFFESGNRINFYLQPLPEVYYDDSNPLGPSGNKTYIFVFGGIAVLILLLACINYMNLTTARSAKRSREVGIRKVIGSSRRQLLSQFLVESLIFSLTATILAILIGEVLNGVLADNFGIRWDLSPLAEVSNLIYILAIASVVAIIAGLYPSLYLSSFNPVESIKGTSQQGDSRSFLRNTLVVFQFIISFGIIIMAFTVNMQIDFLRNRELGFDQERLLVIDNIDFLENKDFLKNEVNQLSTVKSSTFSNIVPGKGGNYELFKKVEDRDPDHVMLLINTDEDFVETFGLGMVEGENFLNSDINSENPKTLINKEAVEDFDISPVLGKKIYALDNGRELAISGIIEDFDFTLSRGESQPIVIRPFDKDGDASVVNYFTVKLLSENPGVVISDIKQIWDGQGTGIPFQYSFFNQIFDKNYRIEKRLSGLLNSFSGIAIFIGILGLVGLVAYSTEQLRKSIGIRKVFGASITGILMLLTKDFLRLLIVAFVIAIPLANYFMRDWLEAYTYKIQISAFLFVIPGITIMALALITIWGQSYRAANTNPIDAIKTE